MLITLVRIPSANYAFEIKKNANNVFRVYKNGTHVVSFGTRKEAEDFIRGQIPKKNQTSALHSLSHFGHVL
jgi:hypothetical protein